MHVRLAVLMIGTTIMLPYGLSGQTARSRDSAGVKIVDNPPRSGQANNLRLAAKPAQDVGGLQANPDDEFDARQGYLRATSLSNGWLAVIDVTRVQFFNAAGKRERTVGRKGQGPADLLYVTAICRTRGDTILLADSQNRRVSVLDKNGVAVRTIPLGDNGSPPFDFCFDDGTFLVAKYIPAPAPGGDTRMRVSRMRLDGTVANVFGEFSGGTFDMVTQSETSFVAIGDRMYYGSGQSGEVRAYSLNGKLLSIVRLSDPRRTITGADVERRLASTIPTNVSADERSARLERMHSQPHAEFWPAYARIHVDRQGRIWMEDYRSEYPMADGWSVFDPSGRLVGRLVFPAPAKGERAAQVISFGDNTVLLRQHDADGADHLSAYSILGFGPGN